MATFDSSAPQPLGRQAEGEWLGWSKSISTPEPDKSGETLGKTIGTAIHGAAELGHDVVESQAQSGSEEILRGNLNKLQDVQTDLLNPPNKGNEDAPKEVQNSQRSAEDLGSARANGAISPTYYYGQLDKLASDMRSRFPMYAQAIDKGIAQGTGVSHTANELYQSTLKDINSFLTKKNEVQNKALSEIQQNMGSGPALGAANAADAWGKVHRGEWTPEQGMAYANAIQSRKFQLGNLKEEISTHEAMSKDQGQMAERVFIGEVNNLVTNSMHAMTEQFGFKNVGEMEYALQHPAQYSAVDMQAVSAAYANHEQEIRKGLNAKANEMHEVINPQTGQKEVWSYAQLHPGYQTNIDNSLKTFHAGLELVKDKDFGSLTYWTRMQAAAEQDVTTQLLSQENGIGATPLVVSALKKLGMEQYVTQMTQDSMKDNLVPRLKAFNGFVMGRSWMTPMQAQSGGVKPAVSLQDDISNFIDKMGVKSPKVFNKFIDDLHGLMPDSNIPNEQKAAKILYTFGPKNVGVLSTWNRNGIQPDGTVSDKPDRWTMLGAMTDPKITAEVRRLDSDPMFKRYGLWDNYKSTTSAMISTEFQKQALDLNQFDAGKNVIYNSDKHEYTYTPPPRTWGKEGGFGETPTGAVTTPRLGYVDPKNHPVQRLLDKLNIGLHAMADIAKAEGSHPDAYIYNMMNSMNVDMSKTSTTGGMMQSLINTHAAQQKKYEDDLNKMVEEVKGLGKKKPQ